MYTVYTRFVVGVNDCFVMCDDMLVILKAAILFVIWFVICPSLISFPSSVCNLQATAAVYQSFCSRWVDWWTKYQKATNL